jgi:CHAD domain-containing protein
VSTLGGDEAEGRKLLRALDRSRRSARKRLVTALSSPRYFELLDALERPFATVADEPSLVEIRSTEHRRLKKAVHGITVDSPDEELHAVRIRVKRARYAAELEGDKPYVSAAKRLQDVLGEHQDAVVAIEKLRSLAGRMPDAAVAAGRLIEREQVRARRTRGDWRASWKQLAKTV